MTKAGGAKFKTLFERMAEAQCGAPLRCETNETSVDGDCEFCGAVSGQSCLLALSASLQSHRSGPGGASL